MAQGMNARLDESLGMRRGKESSKMQSYKSRRDESRGTRSRESRGGSFNLQDNAQASSVKSISTDSEKYDMGRMQSYSSGSKGYPAEAWNYDY